LSGGFHDLYVVFSHTAILWEERKLLFEHSVAFHPDALHAIAGVLIQLATAAIIRKPVSTVLPWLVVLIATFGNEFIDLWVQQWPHPGMQYGESVKDILLTISLPTVIFVTARFAPSLYKRRR